MTISGWCSRGSNMVCASNYDFFQYSGSSNEELENIYPPPVQLVLWHKEEETSQYLRSSIIRGQPSFS